MKIITKNLHSPKTRVVDKIYCPECKKEYNTKGRMIYHLGHYHKYSIEKLNVFRDSIKTIITKSEVKANESRGHKSFATEKVYDTDLTPYIITPLRVDNGMRIITHVACPLCGRKFSLRGMCVDHLKNSKFHHQSNEKVIKWQETIGFNTLRTLTELRGKEKKKQTCLKKYGVECSWQAKEVKDKCHKWQEDPGKMALVQAQRETTCMIKYNSTSPLGNREIIDKGIDTNIKKYGFHRPSLNSDIKLKMLKTSKERYGSWFSQTLEHAKASYQFKEYTLPSGKVVNIQGFEHLALELLLKTMPEEDIIVGRESLNLMPQIWYYDNDLKKHRYFPDIFVAKLNQIIEIKSFYTLTTAFETTIHKLKGIQSNGFLARLIVFDNYGKKLLFDGIKIEEVISMFKTYKDVI